MAGFLLLLLVGLLGAEALAVRMTMRRLRRPPRRTAAWAVSRGLPATPVEMSPSRRFESFALRLDPRSPGEESPVWDIEGDRPDGPVIILTPGWGDSRVTMLGRVAVLARFACRVIVWDPPGHGEAAGLCPLGTREPDMLRSLIGHAQSTHARPVVLYGFSLGAGASIVVDEAPGSETGVRAVIAEAPYRQPWTPARNVLRLAGLPRATVVPVVFALLGLRLGAGANWRRAHGGLGFDRALHAARLGVPLLLLHGTADEICPVADSETIARAATAATLVRIEGGTHNELWTDGRTAGEAAEAVGAFLGRGI